MIGQIGLKNISCQHGLFLPTVLCKLLQLNQTSQDFVSWTWVFEINQMLNFKSRPTISTCRMKNVEYCYLASPDIKAVHQWHLRRRNGGQAHSRHVICVWLCVPSLIGFRFHRDHCNHKLHCRTACDREDIVDLLRCLEQSHIVLQRWLNSILPTTPVSRKKGDKGFLMKHK